MGNTTGGNLAIQDEHIISHNITGFSGNGAQTHQNPAPHGMAIPGSLFESFIFPSLPQFIPLSDKQGQLCQSVEMDSEGIDRPAGNAEEGKHSSGRLIEEGASRQLKISLNKHVERRSIGSANSHVHTALQVPL